MSSVSIAIAAAKRIHNEDDEAHLIPVGSVKERDLDIIDKMVDPNEFNTRETDRSSRSLFKLDLEEGDELISPLLGSSSMSGRGSKKTLITPSELEEEESEELRSILNKQSTMRLRDSSSFSGRREGSGGRSLVRNLGMHHSGSEKDYLSSDKHADLILKMNGDHWPTWQGQGKTQPEGESRELIFRDGILNPEGPLYLRFLYFTIFLAIVASFVAPFNVAYLDCTSLFTVTNSVMYFTDAVFLVDVAVTFMLAVFQKGEWVTDRRELALNYLSSTFAYDVFEALPLDLILKGLYRPTGTAALRVSLVGLFRLLRLKRLIKFFWDVGSDIKFDYFSTSVVKFSALILFFAHWAAAGFFLLARLRDFGEETWVGRDEPELPSEGPWMSYLTSIYWAMTTLSTAGYGDFSAHTWEERLWTALFMLLNLALTAYVLGNMTVLLTKADAQTGSYRDRLTALNRYMKAHRVPGETQGQMRAHLKMHFETSEVRDDVLRQLPSTLRLRLGKHVYSKWLGLSFLFQDTSQVFMDQLVSHMHADFFVPNSTLLSAGDTLSEMYVLASPHSVCQVLLDGELWFENGPGDCLGAFAFVCEMSLLWTVRTATPCRMLVLERDDYEMIAKNHPEDARRVVRNLQERAKALSQAAQRFGSRKVLDMSKLLSREVEAYIQKQDEETTMRLCYAAKRGDLLEVFRLISGGFDLTQADYDGRTALHLAAAYGHEHVAQFLIDKGAPLSPRDCFYRTPLQEAVSAAHWTTADLLRKHGGELKLRNEGTHMCRLAFQGHVSEIEHLLHYGAHADAADYDLRTALHVAAAEGHLGIVRVLLGGGAKVNSVDRWGNTPLDEASRNNREDIATAIRAQGGRLRRDLESTDVR